MCRHTIISLPSATTRASSISLMIALTLIIVMCVVSSPSFAQAVVVPRNVEAGTLEEQYVPPPAALPSIAPPDAADPTLVPEGADQVRFTLTALLIDGVQAYPAHYFDGEFSALIGKDISLADIYQIAGRIRQTYHRDGYVLTQVFLPEQKIAGGVVKIQVVEGFIGEVSWQGEPLTGYLVEYLTKEITAMRPFNSSGLEAVMLQFNDFSGVQVRASLSQLAADNTMPGAAGLVLSADKSQADYQFTIDNYASRYSSLWQYNARAAWYHTLTDYDQLALQFASAYDPIRQRYMAAQYALPIHHSGTQLELSANRSATHPGYTLKTFDIQSFAKSFAIGLRQPIWYSRTSRLEVGSQFQMRNTGTDVFDTTFSRDRIRSVQISTDYSMADEWGGANIVTVSATRGLNILNATQAGDPLLTRARAQSDFTKGNLSASRLQALPYDAALFLAFTGQISSTALFSSEQFGFGGTNFGRGYDASEISGDQGVGSALELRQQYQWDMLDLQPFAFYDLGKVWEKQPGGNIVSAASAGLGLRVQWNNFSLETSFAKPLTYTPANPKHTAHNKEPRLNFQLKTAF